jgi:signal transduction histidine kinase
MSPANLQDLTDEHLEIARELAHSLAVVIQQAQLTEKVRQHTQELEQRVADRTAELRTANEQLKELDRLKSKFISDITHELRTPVTNMLLYLDLISFNQSENHDRYFQVLSEQIHRLRHLVEDSLDLSRLDVALKDVVFVPLALNSFIEKIIVEFQEKAEEKGLSLSYELDGTVTDVPVVDEKLRRMVESLLENAINFTLTGQIQVSTMLDEEVGTAVITFQDTGIGFTEEDFKHTFEPFYRGDRVGQLNIPGNGLGLALVKRIVDMHNGRITVESEVDKGSTITVCLPLEQ